jgi:RNA polymerase sigma-70 factor (ECF subfamily)
MTASGDAPLSARLATEPALAEAFDAAYGRAVQAWPAVRVTRDELLAYLDQRVPADESFVELRVEDLYLACGCAAGNRQAIDAFIATFGGELEAAGQRMPEGVITPADLQQALREKLFTGAAPKIGDYAGRGSLKSWVRVTALRMRIDAERSRKARREIHEGNANVLAALPDARDNPELAHMRTHYKDAFERALAEAFGSLTAKQRNLLRHKLVHQLRHDQLAELYRVHERTIKRWLADARELLLAQTRDALATILGIHSAEVDSVMRFLQSDLDVSVQRYLETRDETP